MDLKRIIDKLIMFLPIIFATACSYFNIRYSIILSSLPGLDKVLESVINFTSIIIGILLALFGVVVTLSDTDVMKKLQQNKGDKTIFKYSIETMLTNFSVLLLSIILQSLLEFQPKLFWLEIFLYFWFFFVLYALASSIRTIYYLLLISFNQENRSSRPNPSLTISEQDRMRLRAKKINQ